MTQLCVTLTCPPLSQVTPVSLPQAETDSHKVHALLQSDTHLTGTATLAIREGFGRVFNAVLEPGANQA